MARALVGLQALLVIGLVATVFGLVELNTNEQTALLKTVGLVRISQGSCTIADATKPLRRRSTSPSLSLERCTR